MTADSASSEPLEPERLTWAVLLARWTDFARSAVALPAEGEPGRVRDSIVDIITLQAVWFALGEVHKLDPQQQAIALDRAGLLIRRHGGAITQRFAGQKLPPGITDLMNDVQNAYSQLRECNQALDQG